MFGAMPDILVSLLRHILTFVGGFIVAKGWISADMSGELQGAIVSIIGILYAMFFHASSNGAIPILSATPNASNQVANANAAPKSA
jgi:hypothetical protein